MALYQVNLWTVTSRENSSLDATDAYGGLVSGAITLPETLRKAKGLRVYHNNDRNTPEDYANLTALVTGIGGSAVMGLNQSSFKVEFNTTNSSNGIRGIYKIDGLFERTYHYSDPLTKGEAMRSMMPAGLDKYTWDGSKAINGASSEKLTTFDFSSDITAGNSTITNTGDVVILPAAVSPRTLIVSVVVDGQYDASGPHDFRVQITEPDGTTVIQEIPSFTTSAALKRRQFSFPLYTFGVNDDLSTTGFKIVFINESNSTLTLSDVDIMIHSVSNPDFTQY